MIKVLKKDVNYWLVRTAGGAYYTHFVNKNFIAIGWNEIPDVDSFKNACTDATVKESLLETIRKYVDQEADSDAQPKGEREREAQKSRIYNQINRFVNEMAIGDIILIPSQGSNLIEFGVLQSDAYTYHMDITDIEEGQCDYVKRRDVTWLHREKRDNLDPYLYGLIYSQHAISKANEYEHYIDRAMNKFYIKGDKAHIVFEVIKQNEISGTALIKLININLDLIEKFNTLTNSTLDKDRVQIKINVQSPGLIELFGYIDEIAIIALLVTAILGGKVSLFKLIEFETPGLLERVKQFIESNQNYDLEKEKIALKMAQVSLQVKNPPELQISSQEGENDESINS